MEKLRQQLITFARGLAAEQWHSSGTYEDGVEDQISAAVARCKADIGRGLLEALEVTSEESCSD